MKATSNAADQATQAASDSQATANAKAIRHALYLHFCFPPKDSLCIPIAQSARTGEAGACSHAFSPPRCPTASPAITAFQRRIINGAQEDASSREHGFFILRLCKALFSFRCCVRCSLQAVQAALVKDMMAKFADLQRIIQEQAAMIKTLQNNGVPPVPVSSSEPAQATCLAMVAAHGF